MPHKNRLSDEALRQITAIGDYIGQDSPDNARRWIVRLPLACWTTGNWCPWMRRLRVEDYYPIFTPLLHPGHADRRASAPPMHQGNDHQGTDHQPR